jgi:hypothetical protein
LKLAGNQRLHFRKLVRIVAHAGKADDAFPVDDVAPGYELGCVLGINLAFGIGQDGEADLFVILELSHFRDLVFPPDADNHQTVGLMGVPNLGLNERHFLHAGTAPCRKEIDQNDFALEGIKGHGLPVAISPGKGGSMIADLDDIAFLGSEKRGHAQEETEDEKCLFHKMLFENFTSSRRLPLPR